MVIGYIEHRIGENVRIKILAFKQGSVWIKSEIQIKSEFPPHGYAFEPGFFYNYNTFNIGHFIQFTSQDNLKAEPGQDQKRVERIKNSLNYEIIELNNILESKNSLDIDKLTDIVNDLSTKFYLKNEFGFYGPLKVIGGIVKPLKGQTVNYWKAVDCFVSYKGKSFVYEKLPPAVKEVDATSLEQKFNWFKKLLASQENGFYKSVYKNTNWSKDFLKIPESSDSIAIARIETIIRNLENIEFNLDLIEKLSSASQEYRDLLNSKINDFKEEYVKINKDEIQKKLDKLEQHLAKLNDNIEAKTLEFDKVSKDKQNLENELLYIKKNKERLLSDFKLFNNIQSNSNKQVKESNDLKTFVVKQNCTKLADDLNLDDYIKNTVELFKNDGIEIKKSKVRRIVKMLRFHRCCLINHEHLFLIKKFVESSKNSVTYTSYVEPNWLSFKNLSENGLSQILDSAHQNSENLHFFLLIGVNISAPECFASPLIDLNSGLIDKFPISGKSWPENLRVIASVFPDDIGLKITAHSFSKWGGIIAPEFKIVPPANGVMKIGKLSLRTFLNMDVSINELDNHIEDFIND